MFLFGGIDSSVLLVMMAWVNEILVWAFMVGFFESGVVDERDHAYYLVKLIGAEHVEVEFIEVDFWDLLFCLVLVMDDLVVDYVVLFTYKLAECAVV